MIDNNFKVPELVNGIERNILSANFEIPSDKEIKEIKIGTYVKVLAENNNLQGPSGERFWCEIIEKKDNYFIGRIDNNLVLSHIHGLYCDDIIKIESQNIISIFYE